MRRFSQAEFWLELERRGCRRVSEEDDLGTFWLGPNGRHFQVPPPDSDGRYPDWLLDESDPPAWLAAAAPLISACRRCGHPTCSTDAPARERGAPDAGNGGGRHHWHPAAVSSAHQRPPQANSGHHRSGRGILLRSGGSQAQHELGGAQYAMARAVSSPRQRAVPPFGLGVRGNNTGATSWEE